MKDREQSLKLLVVLSKTYKAVMDRVAKEMKRNGLSASEFSILELLFRKGKTPLHRIGDKIAVTSGGVTYTVDKLEEKGYLQRVSCPEDRRVTYAEITTAGKELFSRLFPAHADTVESVMGALTWEEKTTAIALMKKLGYAVKRN